MSELTDMTNEVLTSSINEHVNEIEQLVLELEERYDLLWKSYEELDEDHNRLGYKNLELKEENEVLKQQGKEFSGYIELNSYGEGIKKGEQLMQEKVDKIIDYWVNNPSILTQWFGSETTLFQLLEKTKQTCERIEYEKEKGQEIHVGDVVEDIGGVRTLLVTNVVNPYVYTLDRDGRGGVRNKKDVVKTGEHYPLDEFLKELK